MNGAGGERRLRVVAVIARLNVGGPAVNVLLTAAHLDPRAHAATVVCGRVASFEGDMGYLARSLGVEPVVIPQLGPALNPFADLVALLRLYRLMRRLRPDVVHTHTAKAGFLGRLAARLAGVPVVVHTFHGHVLAGYFGPLRSRVFLLMERLAARWSHCVVTLTDGLAGDLTETCRITTRDRVRVVPLGLDLEPFTLTPRHTGRFRSSIGAPEGAPLVGIVGRLAQVKDPDLFVRAAAEVAREVPTARFVVVGDGELRAAIEGKVAALGLGRMFTFTGWRRDMPDVYSDLDVVAITSHNEGTPVTAIEALAAGCPVVATAVGGVPELLEHGRLGRLVPSRGAPDFARGILDQLSGPDRPEAVRRSIAVRYGIDTHVRVLADLYRELLGRGHNGPRNEAIS